MSAEHLGLGAVLSVLLKAPGVGVGTTGDQPLLGGLAETGRSG